MIRACELLLVPLQTKREGVGWNLYRLDHPIIRVRAGDHRLRQLFDGLAMEGIDEQVALLEQGRKPGVRRNRDVVQIVAFIVLEDGRRGSPQVGAKSATIDTSQQLHARTYPEHRFVTQQITFENGALDGEAL